MAHEKLRPQYLFDAEKIEKQKQLTPECFEDGKINFETLRQNLGDWTQNEEDSELEHFGLFWPGKRDARKVAALPPEGTLEPIFGDGLKADGTPDNDGINDSKNIFIEGENLEVLKLLQKSYSNKVKLIYIDPPYNTGNDFVYDDDFTEPLQEYLRRTGQIDEEGKAMTTNKRSDGRFHSKWLSMMYPRLRLARNLMRDDGIIFVSIDDNEVSNLKQLLNEIFGEENFIGQFIHKNNSNKNQAKLVGISCEYFYCYSKNKECLKNIEWKVEKKGASDIAKKFKELKEQNIASEEIEKEIKEMYKRPKYSHLSRWNKLDDRGVFMDADLSREGGPKSYTIINPKNELKCIIPERGWGKSLEELLDLQKRDLIYYGSIETPPRLKSYITDENFSVPDNFWYYDNSIDTKWVKKEFGDLVFQNPKPLEMIKSIIEMASSNDGVVLDFFAGSGTTGHAIVELLAKGDSTLKYILVQIPELINEDVKEQKPGYLYCIKNNKKPRITEITKERLRKASVLNENKGTFKVLKLVSSNFKPWKHYQGSSTTELENKLSLFNENPLQDGYNKEGLLLEIILLEGFTLCHNSTILDKIETNSIKKITDDYSKHALLVCLDDKIEKDTIKNLELGDDDVFVCLDSAISSEDKLRLSDKGLIKTI